MGGRSLGSSASYFFLHSWLHMFYNWRCFLTASIRCGGPSASGTHEPYTASLVHSYTSKLKSRIIELLDDKRFQLFEVKVKRLTVG